MAWWNPFDWMTGNVQSAAGPLADKLAADAAANNPGYQTGVTTNDGETIVGAVTGGVVGASQAVSAQPSTPWLYWALGAGVVYLIFIKKPARRYRRSRRRRSRRFR